jgi:hypothetical protein
VCRHARGATLSQHGDSDNRRQQDNADQREAISVAHDRGLSANGLIKCVKQVNMFAFNPESFATCCQDVRSRCLADDSFGDHCSRVDHMLAIIEHKKYFPLTNKCGQTAQRILGLHHKPERPRDWRRDELGISQRCQIDEENRPVEAIQQHVGDGYGDSGLSDTAPHRRR